MSSVTERIKEVSQPRGGYIKPSQFEVIKLVDNQVLGDENVHASIMGMVVDYLTRFMMTGDVGESFKISSTGYSLRVKLLGKRVLKQDVANGVDVHTLLNKVSGLDDRSIIAACKLCTYDVWLRNPAAALMAKTAQETNPDGATIDNIRIMVNRSITFWSKYGPVTGDGFTFEPYGYTDTVDTGDGDYLTRDTLWDFKVSKSKITNKHTLQLLMYWIMGQHSGKPEFKSITRLGVFNPRLNEVYLLDIRDVSADVIRTVERDVICY